MRENKISSYINFAIKSGQVIFGYDNLFVFKKKPRLVLVSNDLTEKMQNKVIDFCNEKEIKFVLLELSLGNLIARDNCKVLAILDNGLSNAILNEMEI